MAVEDEPEHEGATPSTPAELIELSLTEIGNRVTFTELDGPASHSVILAAGLDDALLPQAVARFAVGFLAGWVERNATIGARLAVTGVEHRPEISRLVDRVVKPEDGLSAAQLDNWRTTWRDSWIAEVAMNALFMVRASVELPFIEGGVVGLMRPHPLPKRQGLDSVAIYEHNSALVVAVGETKASLQYGSDQLTIACDMLKDVDDGLYGPDLRDALDLLADVLPPPLAEQISDAVWRESRCYVPAIFHETPFDPLTERPKLAALVPPRERKRVLVLKFDAFDAFFTAVADAMPGVVDELVV